MRFLRHSRRTASAQRGDGGYILLTLILMMAMIAIASGVIVSSLKFSMERDREEEMIHRGTQYSRAIKAYYKKFNRYPTKIEDLLSSNNIKFLRKSYKDPLSCKKGTCQDFKLLHFGDPGVTMAGGLAAGMISGASPTGGLNGGGLNGGGLNSGPGQPSAFGGSPNSVFGQNSQTQSQTPASDSSQPGSSSSQPSSQSGQPGQPDQTDAANGNGQPGDALSKTVFGGGPIVGVASLSKDKTIREFNHKRKYNEWQFLYDPASDRGGLITTPYQQLTAFQQAPNVNGQGGNSNGIGGGSGSSFGGSSLGNGINGTQGTQSPAGPGYGSPQQPSNPPQQ